MDRTHDEPPDGRSLTLTIPQAARLLGISASKAYEAARCGDLPTIRLGTRVLVSRRRLEELIDGSITGDPPEAADDPDRRLLALWDRSAGRARTLPDRDWWSGRRLRERA